jgi:Transglycosylase SLT domain
MRYLFGCAVLCLGVSAAHDLTVRPATAAVPALSVEELEANSRVFDEPNTNDPKSEPLKSEPKRNVSREEICDSVADAAQAHDLPIAFLASLVWQESRFEPKAVSPVGAQGIAQFMPRVAAAYGVADPFDPIQALPASAKFLRELFEQFGNLGLAAAAYNAGPKRVLDWMAKRGNLPAETRTYVLNITGRPADQWVTKIDNTNFKIPARTPCQTLASLPEWSSAGSGQLNPDLPDVKEKPMIVITKTKVIVTGPQPKTLAIAQPKTKLAENTKVAAKNEKMKVAAKEDVLKIVSVKKQIAAKAEAKTIVVTKSKIVITGAQPKYGLASTQPKSIVAPEPKGKTRLAEQDKKTAPPQGKIKADLVVAKSGKPNGKIPPRTASRVRTASAN